MMRYHTVFDGQLLSALASTAGQHEYSKALGTTHSKFRRQEACMRQIPYRVPTVVQWPMYLACTLRCVRGAFVLIQTFVCQGEKQQ